MYELVSPTSIAQSEEDEQQCLTIAKRLVGTKGTYHGYLFRRVCDVYGNTILKIVAEYIKDGSLQTIAEK